MAAFLLFLLSLQWVAAGAVRETYYPIATRRWPTDDHGIELRCRTDLKLLLRSVRGGVPRSAGEYCSRFPAGITPTKSRRYNAAVREDSRSLLRKKGRKVLDHGVPSAVQPITIIRQGHRQRIKWIRLIAKANITA